jgi:membrane-bound serine protease (ClpP class)
MVGSEGVVIRDIRSEGTVRVRGELWTARAREPIAAGEAVRVVALEALALRVERAK